MRTDKPILAATLLLALALGGCSFAPAFTRPESPVAATLPGADTPHGTDVAWLGGKLFPEFRRLLHETLQVGTSGPRLLWLVMDQLDQGDIP